MEPDHRLFSVTVAWLIGGWQTVTLDTEGCDEIVCWPTVEMKKRNELVEQVKDVTEPTNRAQLVKRAKVLRQERQRPNKPERESWFVESAVLYRICCTHFALCSSIHVLLIGKCCTKSLLRTTRAVYCATVRVFCFPVPRLVRRELFFFTFFICSAFASLSFWLSSSFSSSSYLFLMSSSWTCLLIRVVLGTFTRYNLLRSPSTTATASFTSSLVDLLPFPLSLRINHVVQFDRANAHITFSCPCSFLLILYTSCFQSFLFLSLNIISW